MSTPLDGARCRTYVDGIRREGTIVTVASESETGPEALKRVGCTRRPNGRPSKGTVRALIQLPGEVLILVRTLDKVEIL